MGSGAPWGIEGTHPSQLLEVPPSVRLGDDVAEEPRLGSWGQGAPQVCVLASDELDQDDDQKREGGEDKAAHRVQGL